MATIPAPASWTPRQLWQVPTFLLGLGALAALLVTRPLWHTPAAVARSRLDHARRLLQRADADSNRVIAQAQAYLDQAGPDADRAGEAHFLIGSALVRIARAASEKAAPTVWQQARESLERAEALGVPEGDQNPLRFRLGLCGFYTGADPQRVAKLLAETVEESDDKVEGYRVLALAYLRQPVPDPGAALKANEALRQLPLLGEEVLGPARLQAGELLLGLRRPGEARRVLRTVSTAAAPAILAEARTLLAQTHQAERAWAEAAALWLEILNDKRQPPPQPGLVLYRLGVCYRRIDQLADAAHAWGDCLQRGEKDSAVAAALGLAEVQLVQADAAAVETFARAVRDIRRPEDWKNTLVGLKQARAAFEAGCQVCRQRGDFERSLRLAELYARLAAPGRSALLRGRAAEGWAQSLRDQLATPGTDAAKRAARATELYRRAGEAYALAAEQGAGGERSERLWLSAGSYLRAQDAARAVPVLRKFLEVGDRGDFAGEAWFLLAEAERRLGHANEAEAAYLACLQYRGRFASRARFQLSQAELRRGRIDKAAEILVQNLHVLRQASESDDEALEKSLFAYGALLYRRRDFAQSQLLLEEAVSKFPQSPSAVRGRFELAESCRLLAAAEADFANRGGTLNKDTREHHLQQQRRFLRKAVEQYTALTPYTDGRAGSPLTPQEQAHVLFNTAECHFNLGEYATALAQYDQLAERFKDRLERLTALAGSARCYGVRKDYVKLQERLQDVRVALERADPQTRRQWEEWLKLAAKQP